MNSGRSNGPKALRQTIGVQGGAEPRVTRKDLIPTIAVQHDSHVPPRFLRDQVRGQGRRVSEGFVVMVKKGVDEGRCGCGLENRRRVLRAQRARDGVRKRPLIVCRVGS